MIDDIGSNSKDEIQFDHRVEYKNCLRGVRLHAFLYSLSRF